MSSRSPLAALYESTRAIGLREDIVELIDEILAQAQRLVGFDRGGLLLFDADAQVLRVLRVLPGGGTPPSSVPLDRGLCGWVATNRQPARLDDVQGDPRYLPGLEGAQSTLVVPLMVRNQLVGILDVESRRRAAFSAADEQLLTVFGTQAALAIEASRAQDRLAQELRRLQALHRISQLAASPRDADAILLAMIDITQELIPHGYCAILLLDPATRTLRVRASRGYCEDAGSSSIAVGAGVTGQCAQAAQPIVVDDVATFPGYIPGVPGARSEVAVPMMIEGRVVGVLNAESPELRAYRPEHVRTLSVIGQQAAVVLHAAQVNEETRRLASTDSLTGLANRRQFLAQLEEQLRRVRRYRETLAVAFMDLDDFKTLNDRHGHNRGDRALQAVATAMREWVRETDAVARLGGDEFAAILLRADHEGAWQAVERLRRTVSTLDIRAATGEPVAVRLSAGIALFPDDGVDAETLLSRADAALYQAKRGGKDRVLLSTRDGAGA